MKKLFLLIILFFTKNLFSSESCFFIPEFCFLITSTKLLHECGYKTHETCVFNFDKQNKFDKTCAHCTGIVWVTYGFDFATQGTCPVITPCTPIALHACFKINKTLHQNDGAIISPRNQRLPEIMQ